MGQKTKEWMCIGCNKIEILPNWLANRKSYCTVKCRADNLTASTEVRQKISNTLKRNGIKPPSRAGSIASIKTRSKMSEAQKAWYAAGNVRTKGRKLNISESGLQRKIEATQTMRQKIAARGKLTDIEQIIDNYLHQNNIYHEHEYAVGKKVMDFYVPSLAIFIEADGDYWHQDKEKDRAKDAYVNEIRPDIQIVRCAEKNIKEGTWTTQIIWGKKRNV